MVTRNKATASARTHAERVRVVARKLVPELVMPVSNPRSSLPLELRRRIAEAAQTTLDQVASALSRDANNKGRGAGRKRNFVKGQHKALVSSADVASWLRRVAQHRKVDRYAANALREAAQSVLRGDVEAGRMPAFVANKRPSAQERARGRRRQDAPEITTAAEAPVAVRRLLKSYDPAELRWSAPAERYEVVVAILTRGDTEARTWLRQTMSRAEVRALVAEFRGAGCAEPERQRLREQLGLSVDEIPSRPYLGFNMGVQRARRAP